MSRVRRPGDVPERLLAWLWRNRDWRRRSLSLANGRLLKVLYPGRPGDGSGPDFRDALLQVEGQPAVRGDVEIHREPRGWREHRHDRDPRYNGVVLHVVAGTQRGRPTQREDGEEVPVVGLLRRGQRLDLHHKEGASAGLAHPLLRRWRALPAGNLCRLLDGAGRARFLEKSDLFRALLRV